MRSLLSRSGVGTSLLSILWLYGQAAHAQQIPDLQKMKDSLEQLKNQQPGCPDFMKAMVPSNGKIILCEYHPTMVNTTMELKAEAGKSKIYGEIYEIELKVTSFDPKMGMWAMTKDDTTRQENAKADEKIQEERRAAQQSPEDTGPVEVRRVTDGRAWSQKRVYGEDNVIGGSKKPPEDIYDCDYLIIQNKGLIINLHATAADTGMADVWMENIRAKLASAGY